MTPDLSLVDRTREAILALRGRPVLVGPWMGEVGFELLYWIPFLRWAMAYANLQPEDLYIVSRGGCRSWYADLTPNYVDAFRFYTLPEFKAGNDRRLAEQAQQAGAVGIRRSPAKQWLSTTFEHEVLHHAQQAIGVKDPAVLHPSLMYGVFRLFWRRERPDLYREMTIPARLTPPPPLGGLPSSYVVAKFYASACCPKTPRHIRMVNDLVRAIAAATDVMLLHPGTRYDDHGEFPIARHPRIHPVALEPGTNLDTQTAIVAGATGYVGTYGGFSYLAPFLGVSAQTVYARPRFRRDHRAVIDQVSRALGAPLSLHLLGTTTGRMQMEGYAA